MQKIPTLFVRLSSGRISREVNTGCEWVQAGEGVATRKFDGTCCMVRAGQLFKRYTFKPDRFAPLSFEPADMPDDRGHIPGWVPVSETHPADAWHRHALDLYNGTPPDGTYELIGPEINGNPERFDYHTLVRHGLPYPGTESAPPVRTTYEGLFDDLSWHDIEGIVWHHPDGRMVKIKGADFGVSRADVRVRLGCAK